MSCYPERCATLMLCEEDGGGRLTSFCESSASRHRDTSQNFIKTNTFSHKELNTNGSILPLSTPKKKNVADLALDSSRTEKLSCLKEFANICKLTRLQCSKAEARATSASCSSHILVPWG